LNKTTSVGLVHPNVEAKIVDDDRKTVARNVSGELAIKGYLVMSKYWNDEEKTRETIDDEGWCYSGDLAEMDEHGFVKITGRVKDMIIRGGENIYPIEIESFFLRHPGVKDIQVIGVDDPKMGQEVCAWIIPNDESPTVEDLRNFSNG
jgi:fatty-acyl-CoA synthase